MQKSSTTTQIGLPVDDRDYVDHHEHAIAHERHHSRVVQDGYRVSVGWHSSFRQASGDHVNFPLA